MYNTSIRRAYLNKRQKKSHENTKINHTLTSNSFISDITKRPNNDINNNTKINQTFISENNKKEQDIHENNLKIIEKLQKNIKDIENQNESISDQINSYKKDEKKLNEDYNNIINDIETDKNICDNLKEITISKKRQFINLVILKNHQERGLNLIERLSNSISNRNNRNIRNNRNNRTNIRDALNRVALRGAIERLVDLYRRRRDNEDDPPIPYEQLQSLPSSAYPRNNRRNEKCIICGFVFCYNDVIIKLRNCNHTFHKNCLVNRLTIRQTSKCPICKVSIIL